MTSTLKAGTGGCGCRFPCAFGSGCADFYGVSPITFAFHLNDIPSEALSLTLSI